MTSVPLYRSRPGGHQILPAWQTSATRINDFIHLSEGLSNSYLVMTPEGSVVINTGMGFEAPVHKRNFDALGAGPVRYILLTQGHVDHVGGVDLFREEGTKVVAQANNPAHQEDDARIASFRAVRSGFAFADAIARAWTHIQENVGGRIPAQSRPRPDLMFDRFNLSDIFEYMSEQATGTLLRRLVDQSNPGARLAYWNMLAPRSRPDSMKGRLDPLVELSERLHLEDKAFFYSCFVVEEVRAL